MCGIAGWLDTRGFNECDARPILGAMTDALRHRGPDDAGMWLDGGAGIALGMRRLAILDLSAAGHQPMHSRSERYTVVFNGEIYNFRQLRTLLEGLGHGFRGHSDTEVLLAAVGEWGLREALQRFNGMFAFALWDRQERVLHLCRDRGGEKPLYYGWVGQTLLFASELKALRKHPAFRPEIDRGALARFFRRGYLAEPITIYHGIHKLPVGTWISVSASRRDATPTEYWSWRESAERGAAEPFGGTAEEALDELDALLRDAVKIRLESDVPLGAFLSGGVDSSLTVAIMRAVSANPVATFTIGSLNPRFDEAPQAERIANHLGTVHTAMYATSAEALAVIPRLPTLFDEPFADPSQIPTFLVAAFAREYVTVCLSGDAGDELFGGYRKYHRGAALTRLLGRVPRSGRLMAAKLLRRGAGPGGVLGAVTGLGRAFSGKRSPAERLRQAADVLSIDPPAALYHYMMSRWKDPAALVLGANEPADALATPSQWVDLPSAAERMMYLDAITWLSGDILAKVDRASMGVSLETRVPLLDPRIIEFAWRLPLAFKIRGGTGKWILRRLAYRYVPRALLDRPKQGFDVPIAAWLRGPLRAWAESLLDERRLRQEGYLAPEPVRRAWRMHLSGRTSWHYELWAVLMFQAWLEAQQRHDAGIGSAASGMPMSAAW